MAFLALTTEQTNADSPLDTVTMDLIRTNFDDHESRLSSLPVGNLTLSSGSVVSTSVAIGSWLSVTMNRYAHFNQSFAKAAGSTTISSLARLIARPSADGILVDGFAIKNEDSTAIAVSGTWDYHSS